MTMSKDGFKKAVRLQQTDTFKVVQVRAVDADCFKVVWEALDHFKAIGIHLYVSKWSMTNTTT